MELRGQRKSGLLLGFLMVYSVNLLMLKAMYLEPPFYTVFIVNLLIWSITYFIVCQHKHLRKMRTLFLSIISFLIFSLIPQEILRLIFLYRPGISEALRNTSQLINGPKVIEFMLWYPRYMLGYTTDIPKTFDIVLLIITFSLISILYANLIIKKKKFIYFIIPIILFIFEWYRYIEGVSKLFNVYASAIILYYISTIYIDKISRVDKENSSFKYYKYKTLMYFGSAMVIITIFISNLIIGFVSLSTINEKMSDIFPGILGLRSEYKRAEQSKFSFGSTPYQPLGNRLGGSITEQDVLVMRVDSNMPLIYLRGRVNNIYTGYSWYSDSSEIVKTKASSFEVEGMEFVGEMERSEVTIYPDNILTSTVFLPYFPIEIEADGRRISYNEDLEMYFRRGFFKGVEGSYTIKSVLPKNKKGEINVIDGRDIKKEKYLQLPPNLPYRITWLSEEITRDYNTDYEKIKALENYLVENHTYSLNVSDIPEGEDFVDYFLFDDKVGYCTYYASALAVMGRTLGIPTRYVEGFILPEKRGDSGLYEVKAERAHAWVEAYIEDMGWINFEPTSPYYVEEIVEEVEEEILEDKTLEERDLIDQRRRDLQMLMEEDIPTAEGDFAYNPKGKNRNIDKLITMILIIIIATRFIYLYYRDKRIFSKIDHRRYIMKNYYVIISLYSFIEVLPFEQHSPLQFLKIVNKNLLAIDISDDIIYSVNKAFYSNENINPQEAEAMNELRISVERVVKQKIGKVRYLYHKYLLGDFYRKGDINGTLRKNTSP